MFAERQGQTGGVVLRNEALLLFLLELCKERKTTDGWVHDAGLKSNGNERQTECVGDTLPCSWNAQSNRRLGLSLAL
jgi:hypothetical protein